MARRAWLTAAAAAIYFPAAAIAFAADTERGSGAAGATMPAVAAEDEHQGLPPGKGRDEVIGLCGSCHSMKLVTQQGLSRSTWAEVLEFMVEEQEMAELEPEDEVLVLDYLARFYGPDRLARRMRR